MKKVLEGLGCEVVIEGSEVRITTPAQPQSNADFDAVRQFRASVCVLGPLTSRCGHAKVALPGGDAIGSRPLDMHQTGLESSAPPPVLNTVPSWQRLRTCEVRISAWTSRP